MYDYIYTSEVYQLLEITQNMKFLGQ